MRPFADRRCAGRLLAPLVVAELARLRPAGVPGRAGADPAGAALVLGLPRGGVPVAVEVAAALSAPLDVLLVRKVGTPGHPELAMGAIGEDGVLVRNPDVLVHVGVPPGAFDAAVAAQRRLLADRAARYRAARRPVPVAGRLVVVVDDGIATGATARAACAVVRARGARLVVLAAPVIAPSTVAALHPAVADSVVAVRTPETFGGVGEFYAEFAATTDEEVIAILRVAAAS